MGSHGTGKVYIKKIQLKKGLSCKTTCRTGQYNGIICMIFRSNILKILSIEEIQRGCGGHGGHKVYKINIRV